MSRHKPYIAFELDAMEAATDVARSAGIHEDAAIAGLARMWRHCWKAKTDVVDRYQLAGFFGSPPDSERLSHALASFGFVESDGGAFRVKGAEKYLRISAARSENGRHRSETASRTAAGRFASKPPANGQQATSSEPALTPSIEHRASKEETTTGGSFFAPPEPTQQKPSEQRNASKPGTERPSTDPACVRWWSKACAKRSDASGAFPERPPGLEAFWTRALSELGGDGTALDAAWDRYLEDPWAKTLKPAPFTFSGFIGKDGNRWRQFVRTRVVEDDDGFREFKPGDDLYAPRGA